MKKYIPALVGVATLSLVVACNLYAPLAANSSVDDHLEEAQKCLHEGNFACAVENYSKLPDGDLKNQKLCTVNMARAGFTLSSLINTVTKKSDGVLGELANNVIPWSEERKTAADDAKTYCASYKASSASGDLGVLLGSLSVLLHCANRMSKADQFQATSNSDTECTTAGNKDGVVDESDISPNADGTVSASTPGMCAADVEDCRVDIDSLSPSELNAAGLSDIGSALDEVPDEIKAAAAPDLNRVGLRKAINDER